MAANASIATSAAIAVGALVFCVGFGSACENKQRPTKPTATTNAPGAKDGTGATTAHRTLVASDAAIAARPKAAPTTTGDNVDSKPNSPAAAPVAVTWKIKAGSTAGTLQIDYDVVNNTTQTVHLLDQLIIPKAKGVELAPQRVIVHRAADSNTVRLVAGHIRPRMGYSVAWEAVPASRPVAAGATVTGTKIVSLPLAVWHPYMELEPLTKTPTQATFEVTWLPDEPPPGQPKWEDHPTPQGGKLRTPGEAFVVIKMQTAQGRARKLP